MNRKLVLKISVANTAAGISSAEVYDELERVLPQALSYRLDSAKVTAAAVEFLSILQVAGSVASIAGFLWYVYDRKIGSKKDRRNDSGLYITIDPEHGLHWLLGKDFNSKEDFITDFAVKVDRFLVSDRSNGIYEKTKYELSLDTWIKKS